MDPVMPTKRHYAEDQARSLAIALAGLIVETKKQLLYSEERNEVVDNAQRVLRSYMAHEACDWYADVEPNEV
jgi:hypothetical protein